MADTDGQRISADLRALSREARRLLLWGGSAAELAALSSRIDAIRGRVSGPASTPLSRWLDSLQRRVARSPVETRGHTRLRADAIRGATSCR